MEKNTETTAILDSIDRAKGMHDAATSDLKFAVVRAALAGCSWADIANQLEISKQTAYNRYRVAVSIYQDAANGVTNDYATPEANERTLDRLYNPEPHTTYNHDRQWDYKRNEPVQNSSYECACGWTIVYPDSEAVAAREDIADHLMMHQDEDDRLADADGQEPETESIFSDAPEVTAAPGFGIKQFTYRKGERAMQYRVYDAANGQYLGLVYRDTGTTWAAATTGYNNEGVKLSGEQTCSEYPGSRDVAAATLRTTK